MTSIFVAKLDFNITSEQLKQAFQVYGTVLKATVATDRETGKSRGFGFVEMSDRDEAMAAIKGLDGSLLNGRPIAVKEADQRPDNRGPREQRPDNRSDNRPREPRPDQRPRDERPPIAPTFLPPSDDALKLERKKDRAPEKEKKKERDQDGFTKKPKMSAYKKSGKNNRFFDDDEDDLDDLENASFFNFDDDEEEDDD